MGRATYDSAQEIRNQEINREEGIKLIKKFDGEYSKRFEKEIFKYLSITKHEFPKIFDKFEHPQMNTKYFNLLANKFRSPHLWELKENKWKLRHNIN